MDIIQYYVCPKCDRNFTTKGNLKTHQSNKFSCIEDERIEQLKINKQKKRLHCDKCNNSYCNKHYYNIHKCII